MWQKLLILTNSSLKLKQNTLAYESQSRGANNFKVIGFKVFSVGALSS